MLQRVVSERLNGLDSSLPESDTRAVFNECCAANASCRLQIVLSGRSVNATFHSAQENSIVLRTATSEHVEEYVPHTLCCVSFPHRTLFCAFVGCLVEHRGLDGALHEVVVGVPRGLTSTNLRRSFRVPVVDEADLRVVLHLGGKSFLVEPLNVSENGIEIDVVDRMNEPPPVGSEVTADLQLRDDRARIPGRVRRIDGTHCAIMFEGSADNQTEEMDAPLHGIVLALQQLWLKNRIR